MVFVTQSPRQAQQCPSSAFCTWLSWQLPATMGTLFLLSQTEKQKCGENVSNFGKIKCKPCCDEHHKKHLGFHSQVCALLP